MVTWAHVSSVGLPPYTCEFLSDLMFCTPLLCTGACPQCGCGKGGAVWPARAEGEGQERVPPVPQVCVAQVGTEFGAHHQGPSQQILQGRVYCVLQVQDGHAVCENYDRNVQLAEVMANIRNMKRDLGFTPPKSRRRAPAALTRTQSQVRDRTRAAISTHAIRTSPSTRHESLWGGGTHHRTPTHARSKSRTRSRSSSYSRSRR